MAKTKLPSPVIFQIRPANRGLNVSVPPQSLDVREASKIMNVRFNRGQQRFRDGFKLKYVGNRESVLWIDVVYDDEGFSNLVTFTKGGIFVESGGAFILTDVYDGLGGGKLTFPYLNQDPTQDFIVVDVGEGKYDFVEANGGAVYPASGDYAGLMAFCNGTTDGIIVLAYTGVGTNVEGEVLTASGAPSQARCVVVFDNRLLALGTEDNRSEVRWSSKGRWDWWDPGTYPDAGSYVLGDSPDWIQAGRRLGDYLIIYKERSIYIGRKSLIDDPAIYFDPAPGQGIGLAGPNTVGDLGEEHIFLGWDDVYVFSLRNLEPVGTRIKQELFYGENGILPQYLGQCTGIIAEEYDEYWLFVPTGKWPGNGGEAINNVLTNPQMWDDDADNEPDDWTVVADGDGATTKQTGISLFGSHASRLTFSTGTYCLIQQMYDKNANIDDTGWACMVWAKADGAGTLRLKAESFNSAGAGATTIFDRTFTLAASTTLQQFRASGLVDDADAEQVRLQISIETAGVNLDVDAAHLIDITSVDDDYIIEDSAQYKSVAYINGLLEKQEIPFIVDEIGPWLADTCWVYNYEEDAWSCWRLPCTGFGYDALEDIVAISELIGTIEEQTWRYDEKRLEAFAPTNLLGQCDGNVYEASSLASKDWQGVLDVAFQAYWESKDFDLDRPAMDKTFSRLIMFHNTDHPPVVVSVAVSTDSGLTWQEQDVTIRQGYVNTFADFFVTGPQVRFRVKATTTGFLLNGYAVKIIPRGESHAY